MKLRYRQSARRDVLVAASWYENQQAGLGSRFVKSARSALERIAENPQLYQQIYGDVRRAPVSEPFPHQVFYRVKSPEIVEILAILHPARDPAIWRQRLEST